MFVLFSSSFAFTTEWEDDGSAFDFALFPTHRLPRLEAEEVACRVGGKKDEQEGWYFRGDLSLAVLALLFPASKSVCLSCCRRRKGEDKNRSNFLHPRTSEDDEGGTD